MLLLVAAAFALAVTLLGGGDDDRVRAEDVEGLFGLDVSCASATDDGTRWECESPDGRTATVVVVPDGSYTSRGEGVPAPAGCCLPPEG